ncbi:hypothetical protein BDV12DRAFT_176924 [Aspergillus spectabilis]
MYFSKLIAASFFAALAVATPTPQSSIDVNQIASLAQAFQTFCSETGNGANSVAGQYQSASGSLSSVSGSIGQLYSQFEAGHGQLQNACGGIVQELNSLIDDYQGTESGSASWGK